MSVLDGGIFSRPRGKTGGLVFGAARTREGKLVTARMLVPPSNPNTAAQQTQRTIFSEVQSVIRIYGPSVYQTYFNRSVGQLPGFQSMQSIYMNQMDDSFELDLVNPINLGTLHFPNTFTVVTGGSGQLSITWSDELGSNGTSADKVGLLFCAKTQTNRAISSNIWSSLTSERNVGSMTPGGFTADAVIEVYAFMIGAGTAEGLLSVANPFSAAAGS
jgi:hypothetical protein